MLTLKIDANTYAQDAFAQELLANTKAIAAENKTDPSAICPKYDLLPALVEHRLACALVGPAGTGKSVAVALLAEKVGAPLVIFQATTETRAASLIGRWVPNPNKGVNGDTSQYVYEKGLLLRAYENGYWFDCEEYLQFAPEQQSLLMKLLDGSPSFAVEATGEIVKRHPNFRFIGTGNPDYNGNKDKQKNEAFLDRIKPALYIPALSEKQTLKVCLNRYPQYKKDDASQKSNFIVDGFNLNAALSASSKALLRKELAFGLRNILGLCEMLEPYGSTVISRDQFDLLVQASFGSSIAQVGGGCGVLETMFKDQNIKTYVDSMYDAYKIALMPACATKTDAAAAATLQSITNGDEILDTLLANAGVAI